MATLTEQIDELDKQIKALDTQKRALYRLSESAPEGDKVCPDFIARSLGKPSRKMEYPIEVRGIHWRDGDQFFIASRTGETQWVSVRPCGDGHNGKTYLGINIGDISLSMSAQYHRETGVLALSSTMHNPAIFVPELGRLVFGCESWWGEIAGPDDLKQISDADIDNVWYVRMLKDVSARQPDETP